MPYRGQAYSIRPDRLEEARQILASQIRPRIIGERPVPVVRVGANGPVAVLPTEPRSFNPGGPVYEIPQGLPVQLEANAIPIVRKQSDARVVGQFMQNVDQDGVELMDEDQIYGGRRVGGHVLDNPYNPGEGLNVPSIDPEYLREMMRRGYAPPIQLPGQGWDGATSATYIGE